MSIPIIGEIIKSIDKRKDRISNALGGFANSQAQIAGSFGSGGGLAPSANQIQPLQTSTQPLQMNTQPQGGLFNRAITYFRQNNQEQPQNRGYGILGQTIMQEAPNASSLYEYLMR